MCQFTFLIWIGANPPSPMLIPAMGEDSLLICNFVLSSSVSTQDVFIPISLHFCNWNVSFGVSKNHIQTSNRHHWHRFRVSLLILQFCVPEQSKIGRLLLTVLLMIEDKSSPCIGWFFRLSESVIYILVSVTMKIYFTYNMQYKHISNQVKNWKTICLPFLEKWKREIQFWEVR